MDRQGLPSRDESLIMSSHDLDNVPPKTMDSLGVQGVALRIGSALVLGAMVGIERERKNRPAGLRTIILISLGSAGFVMLGHQAIATTAGMSNGHAELSRILQGLIGGIGFLGAGAVIQNKKFVRGLTTAAAIWCTAAIGAACGLGLYVIASLLSVATLLTLVVLEPIERRYFPDRSNGDDERSESARKLVKDEVEYVVVKRE